MTPERKKDLQLASAMLLTVAGAATMAYGIVVGAVASENEDGMEDLITEKLGLGGSADLIVTVLETLSGGE